MVDVLESWADISSCGRYRYLLTRDWGAGARAAFVMLNPSTADAVSNDATIHRCMGFARAWGFGGLVVANLYAYRATDPKELEGVADPVGPLNDSKLRNLAANHGQIVCAWGARAKPERVKTVARILAGTGAELECLGLTTKGAPRHPLYLPRDTERGTWRLGGIEA